MAVLKKIFPLVAVLSLGFILNCGAKLDSGGFSPTSMLSLGGGSTSPVVTPPTITSISPNSSENSGSVVVTISGTNFLTSPPPAIQLVYGAANISPSFVTTVSATTITCMFNLSAAIVGKWDLVVTNSDGGSDTLVGAFRVYALPTGLTNWWPMDGNGDDAITTNGNTGAISGGITFDVDRLTPPNNPGAAVGDGVIGTNISTTSQGAPILAQPRTMMGWVRADDLNLGDNFLFGYGFMPSNTFCLGVRYVTNKMSTLYFDGGLGTVNSDAVLVTGQWNHVAASYDGSNIKLYLNGELVATEAIALNTPGSMPMYFFEFGSMTPRLKGAIDDVRIYGSDLSQADIQAIVSDQRYLTPPQNVSATQGTYPDRVDISWDPVPDATGYDVYIDTSLPVSSVTPINSTPIAGNIYTASAIPGTVYYYRVKARNSFTESDYSYMVVGYTSGTMTLYKENFDDSIFNVLWDVYPAMGGTTSSFDTFNFINGTASLLVQNSACTGGCGYSYYWGLRKTFGTPISYFDVRVSFTKQYTGSGRVGVFVNAIDPIADDTYLVPFIITMFPSGNWVQRFTLYQDPGNIYSITILIYDVTDLNPINVDDITIHTMP